MMDRMKKPTAFLLALLLAPALPLFAQAPLTLEECRQMALRTDKGLEQSRAKIEMAAYDQKVARANYFPNVSVTGTYMYNNRDLALIGDVPSALLQNAGTLVQGEIDAAFANAAGQVGGTMSQAMTSLMTAIKTNPALAQEYMSSPMWQTVLGMLQQADPSAIAAMAPDVAEPINAIGQQIDAALHPDTHNLWAAAVTVQQPVFTGGKIFYANRMAALAKELAESRYDQEEAAVVIDVDQAYWQIVSIGSKCRLAEAYAGLLHTLQHDVDTSVEAGLMTEADALQIRVKANEADMLLARSKNGLVLAKMLLCKRIGLPLDTQLTLADENLEEVPSPVTAEPRSLEEIYQARPETRSLALASRLFDRKAKVVRADMLPKVALSANYLMTNPNLYNGFQKTWQGGLFNAGVVVSVPLFHGGENLYKYRKARTEARLYEYQYADACEKIELQVTQQRQMLEEAADKLKMASSNLSSAEENLRAATLGFEAGVVPTETVLGAQTAWLSAHSDCIDAGIELQMAASRLARAEGRNLTE